MPADMRRAGQPALAGAAAVAVDLAHQEPQVVPVRLGPEAEIAVGALQEAGIDRDQPVLDAPRVLADDLGRAAVAGDDGGQAAGHRSEEHASELQSLMRISYAVFCLKKTKQKRKQTYRADKTNNEDRAKNQ